MAIIEVRDLKKEYRINKKEQGVKGFVKNLFNPKYEIKQAVKGINFSIDEGETVGYIGANGAGKSTTIKMLTGILTPTSGDVKVNGLVPTKNRFKNNMQIGAVFGQKTQMWWDLPVIESYNLIKKIYEVSDSDYKSNLNKFKEILDLEELLHIPVRQLSLGQKMRCELGAAFIHNPKVVYLDEPTIGLDVVVKEKIRNFIDEINKEKKTTVILTTHDLQDIEQVCKRVIIIDNGDILCDDSLENFKNRFGKYRIIDFEINKWIDKEFNKYFENVDGQIAADVDSDGRLSVKFERDKVSANDVINITSRFSDISDLSITEPSIENIVKDLYGTNKNK